MKKKFIMLMFFTCLTCIICGQSNKRIQLSGLASVNLGLNYVDNGQEGNSIPKIGPSIGLQIIKPFSSRFKIGLELQIIRTMTEIHNYKTTFGYYSPNYSSIIYETLGELRVDEIDIQVPLFLRHNLGKQRKLYIEYGILYKRLISNNSTSNLKRVEYFPLYSMTYDEENRLEKPIEFAVKFNGFMHNTDRFGLMLGFGREFKVNDHFCINVGIRLSNHISNIFDRLENPKFRLVEINVQVPLIK